jgi:SRSO17 transposase
VSPWDHEPLLGQLQREVSEELGDPEGVLVADGSATPKKGTESVGVARQWCGRLGKVESCQIGIYLAYAGKSSCAIVNERLYLPRAWAHDPERTTAGFSLGCPSARRVIVRRPGAPCPARSGAT